MDAKTRSRRIGRPRQGINPDARGQLLDASVRLFAQQGVAATTIGQIAAKAGVTAALVHYYFSNYAQLLEAVATEKLLPTITGVWAPVMETDALVPMVRGLVQRIFKAAETHPWLPSLWLREIVSEGGQLRTPLLKTLRFDLIAHLISTAAAAQQRGEIDPDLEPRAVLLSLLGNTLLPLAVSHVWQQVPALQGIDRQRLARHAEALLVSALSRRPPHRPRKEHKK